MKPFVSFVALVCLCVCFAVLSLLSSARLAHPSWYVAENRSSVESRIEGNILRRIEARVSSGELLNSVSCPPVEANVSDWTWLYEDAEPTDLLPGAVFLSILAVETEARGPLRRGLEQGLANIRVGLGLGVPDWTLGPMQIGVDAATSLRPEATDREIFEEITDACTHGRIAIDLVTAVTEACNMLHDESSAALDCVADRYNGDAENRVGPDYSDMLALSYRTLSRVREVEQTLASLQDARAAQEVPAASTAAPVNPGAARATHAAPLPAPATDDLLLDKLLIQALDGAPFACDVDFAAALPAFRDRLTEACADGDDAARAVRIALEAALSDVVVAGTRRDEFLLHAALSRYHAATVTGDLETPDVVRRSRRASEGLHSAAWLARELCRSGLQGEAFCLVSDRLYAEALQSWRGLFELVRREDALFRSSDATGPSSFAMEALAWRVALDRHLQSFLTEQELEELTRLLRRGETLYPENRRYSATLSYLECTTNLSPTDRRMFPDLFALSSWRDGLLRCASDGP
jgi:hypothetical protein